MEIHGTIRRMLESLRQLGYSCLRSPNNVSNSTFNSVATKDSGNGRGWHFGKNITRLTLSTKSPQNSASFLNHQNQRSPYSPDLYQKTMHFRSVLTASAALVVSIDPVIAISEEGLQHRAAALDTGLESRAQCINAFNVAGSRCAHVGHTSCSASKKAVVSERSPLFG